MFSLFFFFQAEDGIRDVAVTGVQTCALPIFFRGLGSSGQSAGCRCNWRNPWTYQYWFQLSFRVRRIHSAKAVERFCEPHRDPPVCECGLDRVLFPTEPFGRTVNLWIGHSHFDPAHPVVSVEECPTTGSGSSSCTFRTTALRDLLNSFVRLVRSSDISYKSTCPVSAFTRLDRRYSGLFLEGSNKKYCKCVRDRKNMKLTCMVENVSLQILDAAKQLVAGQLGVIAA